MKSSPDLRIRTGDTASPTSKNDSAITSARRNQRALLSRRIGLAASGIWFCAGLLSVYTLYLGRSLFVPIAVAVFAYLTVRPLIRLCSKIGIPTGLSATIVMLVLAGSIGGSAYVLSAPAQELLSDIPRSMKDAKSKLSFVFSSLETVNEAKEDISNAAEEEELTTDPQPVPVEIKQPAWTTTSPIIAGTGNFMSFISIAAVMLYFLMAGGDALINDLMSTLPTFSSKRRFIETLKNVQDALSSYLAWVTAINAGLGLAVGVAMWMLGMPSPVLWGIAAMLLNYIPIVGAAVGVAAAFFVGLVNFDHASQAIFTAGVYMTLTTLEAQFVTPSLLGKSMEMSSVLVFLSIVVWGWMWGIMGVFLAVPILITISMICRQLEMNFPFTSMLGNEAPKPIAS